MIGSFRMGLEELRSRLLEFDRAVSLEYPGQSFRLVLVGGSALILLGYLTRATLDIDALAPPRELEHLMAAYDLSGQVSAYVDCFAYDMEDRLVPLELETVAVECWAASLEDLVASKLHSDRESDVVDIRRPELVAAIDWAKLARIAEEMRQSCLNERRYRSFRYRYEEYKKECGPCDD